MGNSSKKLAIRKEETAPRSIEEAEDLFLELYQNQTPRTCPMCGRPEEEWSDDEWLPEPFETCSNCWDDYQQFRFNNNEDNLR